MHLSVAGSRLTGLLAAATLFGAGVVAHEAHAGGFELPETGARALGRAGAFYVLADDLSAAILNPGAMINQPGTNLYITYNLIHAPVTFDRAASVITDDSGNPYPLPPTSENEKPWFPLGVSLVVSSDFGLDDWRFWAAVYGPNSAGAAKYDQDSAARYMLTELDLKLLYFSTGVAWGKQNHYGVGATLSWAWVPESKFELVVDGASDTKLNPYTSSFDVLAQFDLSDSGGFTATVGGWWRVIPELELGLSGRVAPLYLEMEGDVTLSGIGNFFGTGKLQQRGTDASISAVMPPTLKAGARYRHLDKSNGNEIFDLELNVIYEAWSMLEAYDVHVGARVDVVQPNGSLLVEDSVIPPLKVAKNWKDVIGARIGSTWNAVPGLFSWSLGALYETGAAAADYAYVDFAAYDRVGVATGLSFRFTGVDLSLSYMHLFQFDVTTSEASGKGEQQRPLGQCPGKCEGASPIAANAGTYKTSFNQVGISVQLHFDEWMD
ncbi:MAG: outer membrane protein transport protein [Myxococcales bacterium]|nr:outer membrane protein transport protein [Myxococcales bacterium]